MAVRQGAAAGFAACTAGRSVAARTARAAACTTARGAERGRCSAGAVRPPSATAPGRFVRRCVRRFAPVGVDLDRRPLQFVAQALDGEERLINVRELAAQAGVFRPLHEGRDLAHHVLHGAGGKIVDGGEHGEVRVGQALVVAHGRELHRLAVAAVRDGGILFGRRAVAGENAQGPAEAVHGLRGVFRHAQQDRVDPFGRECIKRFLKPPLQVLHADAQALDDGGDDGRIDADVAESDEVVGLFGQLALCGPAVADADDPIVARQPGELKQDAAELSEGVLLGFDPFPVLDVSETGIQQIDHLHEEHAPAVQILRGRRTRRRGGRLPGARDPLQAVAEFLQKFGSGFVHARLKAAGRVSPGGTDSSICIDNFIIISD